MSNGLLPQQKMPKLIVAAALDPDKNGELVAAYGPAQQQSEDRAVRTAKVLAAKHGGVVA